MADIKIDVELASTGANKNLKVLTQSTENFKKVSVSAFKEASKSFDVFKGAVSAIGVTAAIRAIGTALRESVDDALEFSSAIAEINSILPENEKLTLESKNAFIEFSNSFAGDAQTQARAFYSIVSAGVQTTAKQLDVLEKANKAAVAGLVDINTAATVLVSSVNAYSASALTAEEASDALFIAVREGQTTFGELANTIGSVAPLAAAAGVKFDELAGVLAFITKSGVSTDEAVTGFRATLTGIIKPAEQATKAAQELGVEFSTQALRTKGLAKFFEDLAVATGGSEEKLARLFPNVRALSTVINITRGNFDDFKRILNETADAAGATDVAFRVISESAAFQFGRLTQQLENLPQAFLVNFDKPIAIAIKAIREFVSGEGILLVVNAVDVTIKAFSTLNNVITTTQNIFSNIEIFIGGVAAGFLEAANAVQQFSLSTGLVADDQRTVKSLEDQIAARDKNIASIREQQKANRAEITERTAANDELQQSIANFQAQIEASRQRQVEAAKRANEEINASDKQAIQDSIDAEQTKFDLLRELRAAQQTEQDDLDAIQKELRIQGQEEEFERLSANLGREQALRELAAANQLAQQKKFDQAKRKLEEADRKASQKGLSSLFDFEKNTNAGRAANFKSTLGTIGTLQSQSNKTLFNIGKAAALSTATIDGIAAVQKALAAAPPPFNFALAALVGTATAANIAKIASSKPPGRQEGGFVPGPSSATDNTVIRAAGGELVLNRRQQTELFNSINQGTIGQGGGNTNVTIQGNVIADDESQVNGLIEKIREQLEFRNAQLGAV